MSGSRTNQEAASWFAALRRRAMTIEERERYDLWRADPQNHLALNRMHELWGELASLRGIDVRRSRAPTERARQRFFGVAAALLLTAGVATYYLQMQSILRTGIGEQKTATLSDGSVVALNVASHLRYSFSPQERDISLSDGEAAFFVKKDAHRPFIVHAGGYQVRAVGTAFNVLGRDGVFDVAVKEGVVAIRQDAGGPALHLVAGQRLHLISDPGAVQHPVPEARNVARVPLQSVDEWRVGIVNYADAPVAAIVADVNRFYARPIALASPLLADRRVTMRLKLDERSSTVSKLADMLDADVRPTSDEDILSPRTPLQK